MQTIKNLIYTYLIIKFVSLAVLFALSVKQVNAQTPVTKIENTAGDSVFVSFDDGGLLSLGEFGTGVIPVEGQGVRMMWFPAKAAFRAGNVSGSQWDNENIADYSTAFGLNTTANSFASTAMGSQTSAIGTSSTTMGAGTIASGSASTAMGNNTTANGSYSTAMGRSTTAASTSSLSIGLYNNANTSADNTLLVAGNGTSAFDRSDALVLKHDGHLIAADSIESKSGGFVLPDGTVLDEAGDLSGDGLPTNGAGSFDLSNENGHVASGTFGSGTIPTNGAGTRMMWHPAKAAFRAGHVVGTQWDNTNVGDNSVAFGRNTEASANSSTAMGFGTTASFASSTAMGNSTTASAQTSTAMGQSTVASGFASTAIGYQTTASGDRSTAMGSNTTTNGFGSTTMGLSTTAATTNSLSIGQFNNTNTNADNSLLVAGNGSSGNRSDALVLDQDAGLVVYGELGTGTIPAEGAGTRMMWYPAKGAFRAGEVNTQWDDGNIGDYSVAFGEDTQASGTSSTATGFSTTAAAKFSVAMGFRAKANHDGAFVWADNRLIDFVSTGADQFLIRAGGGMGVGTNSPQTQFDVSRDITGSATIANHTAFIENTNGNSGDVLALRTNDPNPGSAENFITFFSSSSGIGSIQGNGSGGVEYSSSSADFAELLPRLHPAEEIRAGDVVGVFGGKVTKRTEGAAQVMVVTDQAIVLGNNPGEKARSSHEAVSFVGQVPVRVHGSVNVGDLLVASGRGNGSARAVSPHVYDPAEDGAVIGRAWEASPGGERRVNTVIGVDQPAALRSIVARQQAQIAKLEKKVNRIDKLRAELSELKAKNRQQAGLPRSATVVLIGLIIGYWLIWKRKNDTE